MRKILMLAIAAVAVLALAGSAGAAVIINEDGTGFVGKGDVQNAFGWNNQTLQTNAPNVTFQLVEEGELTQDCARQAGNSAPVTRPFTRTRSVNAGITGNARNISSGLNGPNTGWNLLGFGGGGGDPLPTDICPDGNDNPAQGTWAPVSDVVFTPTGGGLQVCYLNDCRSL